MDIHERCAGHAQHTHVLARVGTRWAVTLGGELTVLPRAGAPHSLVPNKLLTSRVNFVHFTHGRVIDSHPL
jgi:hypothetical protein